MKNFIKQTKIKLLAISLLISIGTLLFFKPFISVKKDIELQLVLKTEQGFDFQIFYTQDKNKGFNEIESFRKKILGNDSYQSIKIPLKDVQNLEKLRIDFGTNPGELYLKKIGIVGEKNSKIELKDILSFWMYGIDDLIQQKNSLKIVSNKIDPQIVLKDELVKNVPKKSFDYLQSLTLFITIFFVVYKILMYFNLKKEKLTWNNIIYCLIFISIILLPILKIDKETIDKVENRNLALKSKIFKNKSLNMSFGKESEAWLNDHFYKRRKVINFYEEINKKIIGRIENDRALIGKENWIFYKGDNSIQNFQNINLFSENQLSNINKSLTERKDWLEKKGIKYYTFIAPDKNKIYSEFYPTYINQVNESGKAIQLRNYLSTKKLKITYPYEELKEEKKNGLLYWKVDTHWNQHGAYIGYRELMKEIKKDFPEIYILKKEDFDIQDGVYLSGDLLGMIGVKNTPYLTVKYKEFKIKNSSFTYIKNEGTNGVITKSSKPLKVLIFRDSFTSAMTPYISETFGEVEYIWSHNLNSYQQKIKDYNPDIVIHEMVERYIGVLENNSPKFEGGL
ncbi:MAG: alginate O-acetyltransferase AlgX-related protein [Cetobacterium sp.]